MAAGVLAETQLKAENIIGIVAQQQNRANHPGNREIGCDGIADGIVTVDPVPPQILRLHSSFDDADDVDGFLLPHSGRMWL